VARIRAILRARELEQFNAELEHSVEKQTQELIKTNFKLQEEIQERKQIEEEIRKHKGHLEFLVEEKTKDLAIALDQAVAGSEAKNIFLAQMSHELRTPLNAIIGYSEILLEEVIDDGHDDYIPIVSPITNAGHNLLKIIDSILDIAHVESGKLEAVIQNIDVDELVQEVVDEIIPIISKNKNNLKINISEEVGVIRQDSEKLSKMLENLLDNAAKYTDSGDIVLTVESKMEEGSRYITFKVQDTGIGIEADKIEIIFEPFMQADNSYTRNYDGAGLGLSLVKKYVDLMKGVINVKSEVGVGSSFSICVPVFD
jgi:signal transduction histidine kinase